MQKMKLFAGIILFGSLWGFSECIVGSLLRDANLPAGAIMTGFFAIGLMAFSRIFYKQPGMQLGMGLVAGALRLFNPIAGCHLCSAIAIMAEGALFEIIWYKMSFNFKELKTPTTQISIGILSSYLIYVGGYIVTQILTPVFSSAGFTLQNLVAFIPQIFAAGLLASLMGGFTLPIVFSIKNLELKVKDKLYYPASLSISLLCWVAVILNFVLVEII